MHVKVVVFNYHHDGFGAVLCSPTEATSFWSLTWGPDLYTF
jgi:hypothetical protein